MEAQRPHLDRARGDVEQGAADVLNKIPATRRTAPHAAPPAWLINWENRRPAWIGESLGELLGVFVYVYAGVGATAAFFITTAAKETGFGALLNIAVCYGLAIAFGIMIAGPTSGSHLSPSFTLAFVLFKGFPAKKAFHYIIAQLLGAFIACICVYGAYKQEIDTIYHELMAVGEGAAVFTTQGPASIFALFPNPGQGLRSVFAAEFLGNFFLALLVFTVLDPSNFFVSLYTAPFVIGAGYVVIIMGFQPATVALNAARDVGGRMACAAIYGKACYNAYPGYTALAALTTFPATLFAAFIHTVFLSDTARLMVLTNLPPAVKAEMEANGHNGEPTSLRALTRDSYHEEK